MKEFLYQIFSNPFLKPNTKRQNENRFHFVFTFTFPFFSPVGMRIFMKHHPSITHIIFIPFIVSPPEGGVLPLLWRGVWFKGFKNNPILLHIIFIPTPSKIFVFHLQNWFEKSFHKSNTKKFSNPFSFWFSFCIHIYFSVSLQKFRPTGPQNIPTKTLTLWTSKPITQFHNIFPILTCHILKPTYDLFMNGQFFFRILDRS